MPPGLFHNDADKQRVKDASDIVRIIGECVSLKAKGREFACLCPFHDDHNPSMAVVPHKQIFHCFVCGTGGDVFTFVQKFHKMEFREALEYLAQRAGIELKPRSAPSDVRSGSRSDLFDANKTAADFFRAILQHEQHGRPARELIARRGIAPEMVDRFAIGAAPDRFDGLLLTLQKKGLSVATAVEAGLLRDREGRVYDTFRHRLMFPITDQIGRFIAFGGRKMREEDDPKYLNSPESRVFHKSATLFGLAQAARAIQQSRTAIITEGYTDTIACHQAGVENTVATLGTALTREHAVVLRRLCERVVLLFDGDDAGQRAADRAAEIFFAEPIDVIVATLNRVTDAKDPDELLKREGGRALLLRAIESGTDVLKFRLERVARSVQGSGIAARSRAVEQEVERLGELGLRDVEPVRRKMIVRELAKLAGIDETTITRVLPAARSARPGPRPGQSRPFNPGADDRDDSSDAAALARRLAAGPISACETALGCLLVDPVLGTTLSAAQIALLQPGAGAAPAFVTLTHATLRGLGLGQILVDEPDADVHSLATALAQRLERITEGRSQRLHETLAQALRALTLEQQAAQLRSPDAGPTTPDELARQLALRAQLHHQTGGDLRAFPRRD